MYIYIYIYDISSLRVKYLVGCEQKSTYERNVSVVAVPNLTKI